jgi:hypothetical protein
MKRRVVSLVIGIFILLLPVAAVAAGKSGKADGMALVRLVMGDEGIAAAEAMEVPLFARPGGEGGVSFLTGATAEQRRSLEGAGAEVTVVDPELEEGGYYQVYFDPGARRPALEWYGEVLLAERDLALLHMSPGAAAALVDAGVQIGAITLDTKPWQPHAQAASLAEMVGPDPLIELMIDQVRSTDVYSYTGDLSGEWPVNIGGDPYTIATRYTYSGTPIQKATQYAGEWMADLGLDVEYHQWRDATYPNVIGELPGLVKPDEIYMIGAHLDDVPGGPVAPGADDNASGSVATLLAAEILTQFQWGCTLRFALWTGEEQGLLGSHAYALRAYEAGENILGYLNLDMIAWNTPGSSRDIDLRAHSAIPATLDLAQLFADVIEAYNLELIPQIDPNGRGASDHASFWDYGYTAILGIEDTQEDFNPRYHTVGDLLEHLDLSYYTGFVKASLGTFAHMTGCLMPGGTLSGTVTAASGGAPIQGATVLAENSRGHAFAATTDAGGAYTMTLPGGTYKVSAGTTGYLTETVSAVVVESGLTTMQDFVLEPVPIIRVEPSALAATLESGAVVTHTLWITNDGAAELAYAVHEMTAMSGVRQGGAVSSIHWERRWTGAPRVAQDAWKLSLTIQAGDALPWLLETPTAGTLVPGEGISVAIRFDATGLELGMYRGLLDVESNDLAMPHVSVPVTLTVGPPCVPVTDATLGWAPPMPRAGQVVTFTAEATGTEPISFEWDLGDGMGEVGAVVSHTYEVSGTYVVVLTATNPCGQAVDTEQLAVHETEVQRTYLPMLLRN